MRACPRRLVVSLSKKKRKKKTRKYENEFPLFRLIPQTLQWGKNVSLF